MLYYIILYYTILCYIVLYYIVYDCMCICISISLYIHMIYLNGFRGQSAWYGCEGSYSVDLARNNGFFSTFSFLREELL